MWYYTLRYNIELHYSFKKDKKFVISPLDTVPEQFQKNSSLELNALKRSYTTILKNSIVPQNSLTNQSHQIIKKLIPPFFTQIQQQVNYIINSQKATNKHITSTTQTQEHTHEESTKKTVTYFAQISSLFHHHLVTI